MLNRAHKETKFCRTVLENMAGHGNVIGGDFEDLRDIIAQVEDKSRVGVCLDTCHLFVCSPPNKLPSLFLKLSQLTWVWEKQKAAGHDIRTPKSYAKVLSSFDRLVGLDYLVALHINDSKAPLGAHRDLHQNIGLGFLGLETFRIIMNDSRLAGLPLILETPMEHESTWAREIKLLESLVGVEPDDEAFREMRDSLAEEGKAERERVGAVVERKKEEKEVKEKKQKEKGEKKVKKEKEKNNKKGGRKRKREESEDEEEEDETDDSR